MNWSYSKLKLLLHDPIEGQMTEMKELGRRRRRRRRREKKILGANVGS